MNPQSLGAAAGVGGTVFGTSLAGEVGHEMLRPKSIGERTQQAAGRAWDQTKQYGGRAWATTKDVWARIVAWIRENWQKFRGWMQNYTPRMSSSYSLG
jgi:hypothetical protein